ncbi:hypothetical protein [Leptospira stimsonii]|uniref:Uncharacterized protein n=1 Tax=Leptospira stimsonii TaxID=2202203 RepID=A0ABY2N596_9LEPT|nr:hypothetical protein [Leptospira stimsonii]TGK12924.1 hypothetical protein EHO98_19265 [Leptospira stimsonii]TGM16911.1 hypothetical protein EHQ90_08400 [Leptospira stimsonii]
MSERLDLEERIRGKFNKIFNVHTVKEELAPNASASPHEFDIYNKGKFIGGINTSKRLTSSGNNNTGGQDRVSSEIFWLSLWEGDERRVLILTDLAMQKYIQEKYEGWKFPHKIEVYYFDEESLELNNRPVILH